jgi:hypothetical protein
MQTDSMTVRERFQAIMRFEPFDRLPILEWAGWWDLTRKRWHSEGLPPECTDRYDVCAHFGQDCYRQDWFRPVHWEDPKAPSHGAGRLSAITAGSIESAYEQLRPHLFRMLDAWPVDREKWARWAAMQQAGDTVLWFTLSGFFMFPRELLGIENHLYAFYEHPQLMHQMNAESAEFMLRAVDRVCEVCTPDFMTFAEDMSYKGGPMISEELFDEFMLPYYRTIVPHLKRRGIIPLVDSDGDITMAAPWFERAGIEGILPLERRAGTDIDALRRAHPSMKFIGHFDKAAMSKGEEAIRAEFERLLPAAAGGGFLVSCDHQTPPDVSYQDYQLYLRLFREYAGRATDHRP